MGLILKVLGFVLWIAFELTAATLFFGTPLVGFWLASSLAAYLNGPFWVALAAGLLVFPVLPVWWEVRSGRVAPGGKPVKRITSLGERLGMRTFAVGLVFLGVLVGYWPRQSFVALSTRGDWMLDGVAGPRAELARRCLFRAADGLEGLYRATGRNPYAELVEKLPAPAPSPSKPPAPVPGGEPRPGAPDDREPGAAEVPHPTAGTRSRWPWTPHALHPAVASMPGSVETDPATVARYLAEREPDPILRIKALHDWVADRIAYDPISLQPGRRAPQDARTVFRTRLGVCAGYANLLQAMGEAIGVKLPVVIGDVSPKEARDEFVGPGHAWNAVEVDGAWYLIDVTWDSGYLDDAQVFVKRYTCDYFMPPPRTMALDHFPEAARWQLLATPLSQGEFLRQPRVTAGFSAHGLTLLSPTRSQTDVGDRAVLEIENPRGKWLMIQLMAGERKLGQTSAPTRDPRARLSVPVPGPGVYRVQIYVGEKQYGSYQGEGSVEVVRR